MNKNILLFNPYSRWTFHFLYEVGVYHQFIDRGYTPYYLGCGSKFKECDLYWPSISKRNEKTCDNCINYVSNQNDNYKIKNQLWINDYVTSDERIKIRNFLTQLKNEDLKKANFFGFNIYDISKSSVHTHFRINILDLNIYEQRDALISYMESAALTILSLERIIRDLKPAAVFLFNGRMAITKAALYTLRKYGIRVVAHERGMLKGGLHIVENDHCLSLAPFDEISNICEKNALTSDQIKLVKYWLNDRVLGTNINWKPFVESSTHYNLEKNTVGNKKIITLFTSSTDEIMSEDSFSSVFENQYKWIIETIRYAEENCEKISLIIRVHPNSASSVSTGVNLEEKNFYDEIYSKYNGSNIKIYKSFDKINSYNLIEHSDLILVYGSTIGLEARLFGKQVFVACNSPVSYVKGMLKISDISNYFKLLDNAIFNFNESKVNISRDAFRFCYYWIFEREFQFSFIETINLYNFKMLVKNTSEFNYSNYKSLDSLVDIILGAPLESKIPKNLCTQDNVNFETLALENLFKDDYQAVLLSVVVVCNDSESDFNKCLESIFNDRINDIEVLIVLNHDVEIVDESLGYIYKKYPDSKIKFIKVPINEKISYLWNTGIKASNGRYILPLKANDTIAPGFIKSCLEILKRRPEVNLVFSDSIQVDNERYTRCKPGAFSTGTLLNQNSIPYCSMFSKALWAKIGGYRLNVSGHEDWDFWLNASLNGAVSAYYEGEGLIYHISTSDSESKVFAENNSTYAQIILNNIDAYNSNFAKIRWARHVLSELKSL